MTPSEHSPSHPSSQSCPDDKKQVLHGLRYRHEWKENGDEDSYSLDLDLARKLQEEENAIANRSQLDDAMRREDEELARRLATEEEMQFCIMSASSSSTDCAEFDLHSLFLHYNDLYFGGKLSGCEVRWSSKMTLCAGQCHYHRASGYCSIRLSEPLLKFRPTSDSVNTLLHEMIHAFLFVTDGNDDHDGHGPNFQMHMARINQKAGTTITIFHNFHDEVDHYRTHIWKCDGPCSNRPPYYGIVKRSMNRPPQPADSWYQRHVETCGGTFTKISEPDMSEKANLKKSRKRKSDELDARESSEPRKKTEKQEASKSVDIRKWFGSNNPRESGPHDKGKETPHCEERQVPASGSIETYTADATPNPKLELGKTEVVILSDSDEEDNGNTPGLLSKDDKFVQCPVCSVHVLSEEINPHLDRCL